ncbi:Ankyrin repeat-containing protein [Camellia lanceoleosa]|uniref:Ankyrin repeat-containing protein n=1 Tax=Camellia lanceoleosa TaxID=1840588 RepID=A0ACC0HHY6_9ERIC|nr:Ankyrin repeat-containing protein [Camellia lanceoleosa]
MYGWTPLHYAAQFGHVERAKQLLDVDKSIAYMIADKHDKKTALHVAASQGHVGVMKELRSQCPDCWEMVNDKGQNILHVAVQNENKKAVKFILENSQLSSLINHKDIDGNTPLHLAATALYENRLIYDQRADRMAFNKENQTPLDVTTHYENALKRSESKKRGRSLGWRNIISNDNKNLTEKMKANDERKRFTPSEIKKTGDTHLIVAALIATVTFAVGFTMPGGYDGNPGPNQGMATLTRETAFQAFAQTGSINIRPIRMPANITKSRETNLIVATLIATVTFTAGITMPGGYINDNKDPNQGMAILTRKAAFIAFVITDTIALTLSVFAVLTQLYTMTDHPILLKKQLGLAFCHTAYAMIAMWLAFITGTYAVLAPSSLSISVCVIPSILLFNYLFHIMYVLPKVRFEFF